MAETAKSITGLIRSDEFFKLSEMINSGADSDTPSQNVQIDV